MLGTVSVRTNARYGTIDADFGLFEGFGVRD